MINGHMLHQSNIFRSGFDHEHFVISFRGSKHLQKIKFSNA